MFVRVLAFSLIFSLLAFTACEINIDDLEDEATSAGVGDSGAALSSAVDELPVPLSSVRWLSPDVSGWSKTATLSAVTFGGGLIHLPYDKTRVWPNNSNSLNANAWIFINRGGTWYAATFEYMRAGYTTRGLNTINAAHLKQAVLNNWVVESGVSYGWMVSGLARGGNSNVRERSNIKMATWP